MLIMNTDVIWKHCWKADEAERQFEIIAPRLSWAKLAALEPRLDRLFHQVRRADADGRRDHFCSQYYWHHTIKPKMAELIGYSRPDFHLILGTEAAYDLAYDTLNAALPPCRNCPWCG
jgi:hypothetical protein